MQNTSGGKSALGLDSNITALIGYIIGIVAIVSIIIEKIISDCRTWHKYIYTKTKRFARICVILYESFQELLQSTSFYKTFVTKVVPRLFPICLPVVRTAIISTRIGHRSGRLIIPLSQNKILLFHLACVSANFEFFDFVESGDSFTLEARENKDFF